MTDNASAGPRLSSSTTRRRRRRAGDTSRPAAAVQIVPEADPRMLPVPMSAAGPATAPLPMGHDVLAAAGGLVLLGPASP